MTLKEKLIELTTEEDSPYYVRFLDWFNQTYVEFDSILGQVYTVRYETKMKKFFIYNQHKGIYEELSDPSIKKTFFDWADNEDEHFTTPSDTKHVMDRIKSTIELLDPFDADPDYECCINGLVNKHTKQIIPHTPAILFKHRVERNYKPEPDPWSILTFKSILKTSTDDWENVMKFFIAIVHKRLDIEMFLICYGPGGSGKSTILQIPTLLFGKSMTAVTPLHKFGKRFGLKEMYDKRVNVCADLSISSISEETIGYLKRLTGEDPFVEIEMKGLDSFMYQVQCFLLFGTNQLFEFGKNTVSERDSIMRRACLAQFNKKVIRCPQLKDLFTDPEFLDDIYSWLIQQEYIPIVTNLEVYIEKTSARWMENSNPILTLCRNLYRFVRFNSKEGMQTIPVNTVVMEIKEALEQEGFTTPNDLTSVITQALKTMKIERDNKRGANAGYMNIARNTEDEPEELTDEEMLELAEWYR